MKTIIAFCALLILFLAISCAFIFLIRLKDNKLYEITYGGQTYVVTHFYTTGNTINGFDTKTNKDIIIVGPALVKEL